MDSVRRQVRLAQRYLNGESFMRWLTWCLSIGLGAAVIAILIPKFWALPFLPDSQAVTSWTAGWTLLGLVMGLLVASVLAWLRRASSLAAALEIDHRFKLRERLSSALSLPETEHDSPAGEALLRDARRSAERLDVRDQFSYGFHWRNLTPLLPLAIILVLWLVVENAAPQSGQANDQLTAEERDRIEEAQEVLRKKLKEEVKRAEDLGLKEAEVALREVDRVIAERKKDERPKEDTLVRLNDAKQKLEERVKKLGDAKSMQNRLSRLQPERSGPADKVAQALSEGKLDDAVKELEQLADKAQKGELSPKEKQALSEQLADLQKQLQKQADQQREREQSLEQQLEQAKSEGDQQRIESLEQQLAEQQQQNPQTEQLDGLADSMGQASQSMSNQSTSNQSNEETANSQAGQALSDAAEQLQEVNANLTESQMLDGMLDQIGQCKRMVQDPNGQQGSQGSPQLAQGGQPGNGESGQTQSPGQGEQPGSGGQGNQGGDGGQGGQRAAGSNGGNGNGQGNGAGQGSGARAENENPTEFQDSQVAGNPKPGEAVVTGSTGGVNVAGKSRSEVYQEVQASLSSNSDPLTEQTLPRRQRDQAREYFRQFSKKNDGQPSDSSKRPNEDR